MRFWHFFEYDYVGHFLVAEDEAQAKAVMVGMVLSAGTEEESSEHTWSCQELTRKQISGWSLWYDDNLGEMRPPLELFEEQAKIGPGYVACSEY